MHSLAWEGSSSLLSKVSCASLGPSVPYRAHNAQSREGAMSGPGTLLTSPFLTLGITSPRPLLVRQDAVPLRSDGKGCGM